MLNSDATAITENSTCSEFSQIVTKTSTQELNICKVFCCGILMKHPSLSKLGIAPRLDTPSYSLLNAPSKENSVINFDTLIYLKRTSWRVQNDQNGG